MTTNTVLSVASPTSKFEKVEIPLRPIGDHDVKIEIAYSGICHSDLHQARNEWFPGIFPMVPGHEIAGHVVEVGSKVTKYRVGDRAGVGTIVGSCGVCEYCLEGRENVCLKGNVQTYNGRYYDGEATIGGYAKQIVVNENFVLRLPESLDLAGAAPLLCAGITLYSPLKRWGAGPGKRVGIIGLGGLGHMGVKFAVALGAEVSVIGRSADKTADALEFGAVRYIDTTVADVFDQYVNTFDIIINTTSANLEVDKVLAMLRVGGSLVNVGLPGKDEHFNPFSLVASLKSISGSNTGSIKETQEMLDFSAAHGIQATFELLDVSEASAIDEAYDRMVKSDVRYRFVIDVATL